MSNRQSISVASALVLLGGVLVVWHASFYDYFVTDDAFISFRYSQRLVEGEGLTWTNYDRVEGYSNLLWVLLCAIPALFGGDLVMTARVLGLLATMALFAALVVVCSPRSLREFLAPAVGIGFLAASDSIGVWAMGGLENAVLCGLLVWGSVAVVKACVSGSRRWLLAAALCFGLLCWTRPDAALWPVVAAPALVLGNWRARRNVAARVLLATGLFVVAQLVFRLAYYDDYLPNTAYAKVALSWKRVEQGFEYVRTSLDVLAATWLSLVLLVVACWRRAVPRVWISVVVAPALVWTLYMVFVGGDIFPAWRQLLPVVALGALAATLVCRGIGGAPSLQLGVALVVLVLVGTRLDPRNWAKKEKWQWDGRPIGKLLKAAFSEQQPLVAADAAGTIPFYSRLPALDMLGLTDRYLAHNRPRSMGSGTLGHELGDARYYLERAPDIFCFGVPPCFHPPKFRAQHDMVRQSEFQQNYVPLRFAVRERERPLVSELWIRTNGQIGIEYTADQVRIPAYFFATNPHAIAHFVDGEFKTRVGRPLRVDSPPLRLSAGEWQLRQFASGGNGTVIVRKLSAGTEGGHLASGPLGRPLTFTLANAEMVRVQLAVEATTRIDVGEAVFLRNGTAE